MKIALIFAMEVEAQPLIEELGLHKCEDFGDPRLPFRYYLGHLKENCEILVSLNGKDTRYNVDNIGTEPAALNAYITLSQFRPDFCLSVGTAGGFQNKGAKIGDIYVSCEEFRFHDRRIPFLGFEKYGIGNYPALSVSRMASQLQLKEGVVSTGNSVDHTPQDLEMIRRNNGSVKEMEAAAIAWIAYLLKTPFFALKAVTDLVDLHGETVEEQFVKNLEYARSNLKLKTIKVLQYLCHSKDL